MSASLIIWLVVAAVLFLLILFRAIDDYSSHHHRKHAPHARRMPLVELGKEKDEFYIAGDPVPSTQKDEYGGE